MWSPNTSISATATYKRRNSITAILDSVWRYQVPLMLFYCCNVVIQNPSPLFKETNSFPRKDLTLPVNPQNVSIIRNVDPQVNL